MSNLFQTARRLEELVVRETGLHTIVDFYLALLYRALGITAELFTPVFAVSRMPGWVAHAIEQYREDRLLRPRAAYIGPANRGYRPMRQRS